MWVEDAVLFFQHNEEETIETDSTPVEIDDWLASLFKDSIKGIDRGQDILMLEAALKSIRMAREISFCEKKSI